jgi:hypothetical protein
MRISNPVAIILTVIAIILLIFSIYVILDRGITPLVNGVQVTTAPSTPLPPVPTFGPQFSGTQTASGTETN